MKQKAKRGVSLDKGCTCESWVGGPALLCAKSLRRNGPDGQMCEVAVLKLQLAVHKKCKVAGLKERRERSLFKKRSHATADKGLRR